MKGKVEADTAVKAKKVFAIIATEVIAIQMDSVIEGLHALAHVLHRAITERIPGIIARTRKAQASTILKQEIEIHRDEVAPLRGAGVAHNANPHPHLREAVMEPPARGSEVMGKRGEIDRKNLYPLVMIALAFLLVEHQQ